jgi:hypothetical protein
MVAKAMLLTSNRGFAEWGEVFGSSPSAPLHPRYRIQIYSVMSKIIHLTSGEVTLQINKGAMQHWVGSNHAFPGKRGQVNKGRKDDPDHQVYHAAHDSWKAD